MSGQDNSSTPNPTSSRPRIGRIGQWGATDGTPSGSNRSQSGGRIATFRDLQSSGGGGRPTRPDAEGDEEHSEGQTFFAGGERSGLSIQDPNRRGEGNDASGSELVQNLLKKAIDAGAASSGSSSPAPLSVFGGSGHTLGSDEVESQLIPDPNAAHEQPATQERVIRHITFWRNGFSVEDGPLFRYDDPANSDILRAIDQGTAPAEVMNVRYGEKVELRVSRRAGDDYVPPPRQAFEGSGHRLGAPTPPIAGAGSVPASSAASTSGSTPTPAVRDNEPENLQIKYQADESEEGTTTIRIRLTDGTIIPCRMNLTHTVGDIRNFINAARAENLTRSYTISTTYPNRVLRDNSQTIEAAKLQKSVVVQRWEQ